MSGRWEGRVHSMCGILAYVLHFALDCRISVGAFA